jgi:translation elongation factor EF-G
MALVGQSGAGKTSLVEALLAKAGAIPAAGSVERGTTVGDYTPLEKQLQHSLKLAVASFDARIIEYTCWTPRAIPTSSATPCPRSPPSRPRRS